jgi:DNA-binding XRE family transcriptional regulator
MGVCYNLKLSSIGYTMTVINIPTYKHSTHLLNKKIGLKIRLARVANDMTQAGLAKIIQVSPRTISFYETGTNAIDATTLFKLATALNQSVDYFTPYD